MQWLNMPGNSHNDYNYYIKCIYLSEQCCKNHAEISVHVYVNTLTLTVSDTHTVGPVEAHKSRLGIKALLLWDDCGQLAEVWLFSLWEFFLFVCTDVRNGIGTAGLGFTCLAQPSSAPLCSVFVAVISLCFQFFCLFFSFVSRALDFFSSAFIFFLKF